MDVVSVHSEDLEKMIQHLVERIDIPLRLALHNADVRKDSIEFVELIGGSTRVPAFKARVAEFFGNREGLLSTTLNQDEAVARGCAFQVRARSKTDEREGGRRGRPRPLTRVFTSCVRVGRPCLLPASSAR